MEGFQKVSDTIIEKVFAKDGETVEDANERKAAAEARIIKAKSKP